MFVAAFVSSQLTSGQTNILVDNSGHARIADFGLAPVVRDLDFTRSAAYHHGQTARWAAPEILNGGECSKEADIFSLAMVTIEVPPRWFTVLGYGLLVFHIPAGIHRCGSV